MSITGLDKWDETVLSYLVGKEKRGFHQQKK